MLKRIGRYRLLEQIGTGGQGRVYRAEDTELRRTVAVKVMNQTAYAEPQYVEAIRREAQVAASLDHPNIVTVFDSGIENDLPTSSWSSSPTALTSASLTVSRYRWRESQR